MSASDQSFSQQKQNQQSRQSASREEQDPGSQCPACGNAVRVSADICEQCGHWLKTGNCCFCYSEVKPGQKFCRECGNPPLGINCPNCQTFSHFDFCHACNTPLSKRAKPFLEQMKQSPAFAELIALSKQMEQKTESPAADKNASEIQTTIDQLKRYLQQFETPADKKQTQDFSFTTENIDATDALKKATAEQTILQQKDNTEAEQELMKKIALLQQQTFTDNQSARLFYTAIKILIPEMVKTKEKRITGWLCNFAGVIHAAPHECSEPNLGGEWQFETYTSYDTIYSEH